MTKPIRPDNARDPERDAAIPKPAGLPVAAAAMPPVLPDRDSPAVRRDAEQFNHGVAAMFERWLAAHPNANTQRAYRQDVVSFARFVGLGLIEEDGHPPTLEPLDAHRLLRCSVADVQEWRDFMMEVQKRAPKTVLRRFTTLSRFYEYMREQAAEFRIPIIVPNPAHKNHVKRFEADPVRPTEALTPGRIRELKAMAAGDSVLEHRDRAIIRFYLYSAARIRTGCLLRVEDCFFEDPDNPYVKVQEKGRKSARRKLGINPEAREAIQEYLEHAGLTSGPLFRPRKSARSDALADREMEESTMYRLLLHYLCQLRAAMKEEQLADGTVVRRCIYTPHAFRATAATQLDEAGVPTKDIQKLLGHKQQKTTEVYIKTQRGTKESASHKIPY